MTQTLEYTATPVQAMEVPLTIEDLVKRTFPLDKRMWFVAECESGHKQFKEDGSLLRGGENPQDVGIFQINEYYHNDRAVGLGIDIKTTEGNLTYAKRLYDEQGTRPWVASRECWIKKYLESESPTSAKNEN